MALDVFTPPRQPSIGSGDSNEPRVNTADFGDGYQLRSEDGLNADLTTYPLTWNGLTILEATAIRNFLRSKKAVYAFLWTPPGDEAQVTVICKKWSRAVVDGGVYSMTAEFTEVADLAT